MKKLDSMKSMNGGVPFLTEKYNNVGDKYDIFEDT